MKFEFILHRPGIASFDKKTGEPYGYEPEVTEFEATSNTGALNIARKMFKQASLDIISGQAHFNVSRAF